MKLSLSLFKPNSWALVQSSFVHEDLVPLLILSLICLIFSLQQILHKTSSGYYKTSFKNIFNPTFTSRYYLTSLIFYLKKVILLAFSTVTSHPFLNQHPQHTSAFYLLLTFRDFLCQGHLHQADPKGHFLVLTSLDLSAAFDKDHFFFHERANTLLLSFYLTNCAFSVYFDGYCFRSQALNTVCSVSQSSVLGSFFYQLNDCIQSLPFFFFAYSKRIFLFDHVNKSPDSCPLLLLLSHFSRIRLCVTPQTTAHQAPPSLGFSRQEHWSGLPFPSPMQESEK